MIGTTAGLAMAVAVAVATPASAADFTLKVASPTNNDATLEWMKSFERKVEDGSDDRIEVELYPASQLGQIPATIEGAVFGTIEVTAPASGFFVKYDDRYEVFGAPGLFANLEKAQQVLADPDVLDHIAAFGADQGLTPIAAIAHGPVGLLSSTPVETIGDLQGLKIRVAGPSAMNTAPMSALGASPISMPLGEVLPALQTGTVDGFLASLPVFTTFKYYDVATDLTIMPETYLIVPVVASQAFLDTIGPELTELVRSSAREALADANAFNLDFVDGVRAEWEANGGRVIELGEADAQAYLDAVAAAMPDAVAENAALGGEVAFMEDAASRVGGR